MKLGRTTKFMKIMRIQMALLATFTVLSLGIKEVLAQGTAFTYQGRLNVSGTPASGTYDFRYRLALDPNGNTYFGSSILASGQAISNGLFTATLDFGAGAFTGGSYWLEVDVRTNGVGGYTALSPLQPVTPAPYAIFSGTSSNALNATAATTAATATTATTASAVGANGVTSVSIQNNAVTAAKIASGQVVKSVNGLQDAVTLSGGNNVTITPSGQTLTIAAAGGQAVTSLNGLQGAVTLAGNSDISVSTGSGTVTMGTTAASANTASTIVKRDASGNFSAGTVTLANNLNLPGTTSSSGIIYFGGSPYLHTFGSFNFFGGLGAGNFTAAGSDNVGIGASALSQSTGNANTAIGYQAMSGNNTGNANIALGVSAGSHLTTGSRNICIGNQGVAGDDGTTRIGDPAYTYSTVIAGIYGNNIANAIPVYISPAGSLGTSASSAKFKQNIKSMGDTSDVLLNLRPVTFQYKPDIDPEGIPQYGLVAEDVEKVNPEVGGA